MLNNKHKKNKNKLIYLCIFFFFRHKVRDGRLDGNLVLRILDRISFKYLIGAALYIKSYASKKIIKRFQISSHPIQTTPQNLNERENSNCEKCVNLSYFFYVKQCFWKLILCQMSIYVI